MGLQCRSTLKVHVSQADFAMKLVVPMNLDPPRNWFSLDSGYCQPAKKKNGAPTCEGTPDKPILEGTEIYTMSTH